MANYTANTNPITLTLNQNVRLRAVFELAPPPEPKTKTVKAFCGPTAGYQNCQEVTITVPEDTNPSNIQICSIAATQRGTTLVPCDPTAPPQRTIRFSTQGATGGSIQVGEQTSSNPITVTRIQGTTITATAVNSSTAQFRRWIFVINGVQSNVSILPQLSQPVTQDIEYVAVFEAPAPTVTNKSVRFLAEPDTGTAGVVREESTGTQGTTISPAGLPGTQITVRAIPGTGWQLKRWESRVGAITLTEATTQTLTVTVKNTAESTSDENRYFAIFERIPEPPPPVTYTITPSTTTIDETQTEIVFAVTTENIPNGTVLYWTNAGTSNASDFIENINGGTVTIVNGTASIALRVRPDQVTEQAETIILQLRTGSATGAVVATAPTVSISDTSLTPPPQWRDCQTGNLVFNPPTPPSTYREVAYIGAGGGTCYEPTGEIGFVPALNTINFVYQRESTAYPTPVSITAQNPSYGLAYRVRLTTNPTLFDITPAEFTLNPRESVVFSIKARAEAISTFGDGKTTFDLNVETTQATAVAGSTQATSQTNSGQEPFGQNFAQ